MNWFEEQVEARRKNDADALENAYSSAVNAVLGESYSFSGSVDALTRILDYYHVKNIRVPDKITDENEKLSYVCRAGGLMKRSVRLEDGWYQNAFGVFLCRNRQTGEYTAVVPNRFGRYSFYDAASQKSVPLNRKTQRLLAADAVCFYRQLPQRKLSFGDVLRFSLGAVSIWDMMLVLLMMGAATLLGLLSPKLSNFLFSEVVDSGNSSLLLGTMVFILSLNISMLFLSAMRTLYSARISVKVGAAVESASMARVLSLQPAFFRDYSTGELTTRLNYMNSVFSQVLVSSFSTMLSGLFSLAYVQEIFRFTPALVVPALCIIGANVVFSVYSALRQIRVSRAQMVLSAKANGKSIEMISGMQKIKMSGSEKRMFANYTEDFSRQARLLYNPPFFNKYSSVISSAISLAGTLLIYGAAIRSGVTVAGYYAFQTSYGMISAAVTSLVTAALEIANLRPSLEMIKPLLDAVPEDNGNSEEVISLTGNIEISNVSFKYPGNPENIIDHLSLKISAGEYVAIVGRTGCGKSTLIRLLLGFETPQSGSVYYDSRDLNTLDKRSLRRKIGTVMQDDKLFTGDIYSNIVICAPHLTVDDAWEAAETAGIAEDIRKMPMGMHTLITEGAGGISGGQRQRLAIARAIAPKPSVLIFDEATSALDNITQKKVSEALDSLHCTRIVIAHRLSTIRHCSRILVMDGGHITASGKYEELLEKSPLFAELVRRQQTDS